MNDALKAYLDGEATPAETKAVEAALESDASLQESRSQFEALSSVLRHEVTEPRSIGFERTLMAMAEAERVTRRPAWLPWIPRLVAAAAVCAVVAFPAFFVNDKGMAESAAKEGDFVAMNREQKQVGAAAKIYSPDVNGAAALTNLQEKAKGPVSVEASPQETNAQQMYTPDATLRAPIPPFTMKGRAVPPVPRGMGGRLPPGPITPMVPDNIQALPSVGGTMVETAKASKADLDGLEKAIRQAASAAKGQIVGVSKLANAEGATGRTILVSLSPADAAAFADRARKLIGASGSVSDPIDQVVEPTRVAFRATKSTPQADAAFQTSDKNREAGDPKKRIEELKAKRVELLKEYYEDAKPVKEIDDEIASLQKKSEPAPAKESGPKKLVQVTLGGR